MRSSITRYTKSMTPSSGRGRCGSSGRPASRSLWWSEIWGSTRAPWTRVTTVTAIIKPLQVAILGTARAEPRAVVRDGVVVVRQLMTGTASSDHRAADGVGAARFQVALKELVESPDTWARVSA